MSWEIAKKSVAFLLIHHFILTKTLVRFILSPLSVEGPGTNGDTFHSSEETDHSFIFWIYGGGTCASLKTKLFVVLLLHYAKSSYHYYFGVEVQKEGGFISLIDCSDEQWDSIQEEYGVTGNGVPPLSLPSSPIKVHMM